MIKDKSIIPLLGFVGTGLMVSSTFGFYKLFFNKQVKLFKKERMMGYPKP
jgi:hypothetical protein